MKNIKDINDIEFVLKATKSTCKILANLTDSDRTSLLHTMADMIQSHSEVILAANAKDMQKAITSQLANTLRKRLELNAKKIQIMSDSIRQIAALPSPLGKILARFERPSGLHINKISVPIGVIGIIYESRPNVTSDVSALCIKSGNATVLKGGKEAICSNLAILESLHSALKAFKLPTNIICMIHDSLAVERVIKMDKYIDLLIPRGGEGLINFVKQHSTIPIVKHDKGVCHIYVQKSANQQMAKDIILNAKLSYPAACNACECILLDEALGDVFVRDIIDILHKHNVRVMFENQATLERYGDINDGLADFHKEYGDKIINLRLVSGFDVALEHIEEYGSKHSESIITQDKALGEMFLQNVDAACVYVNASTRFSDGGEFGFGAEVGISTSKIHARGPMGIDTLCSYKYCIRANGAVRE